MWTGLFGELLIAAAILSGAPTEARDDERPPPCTVRTSEAVTVRQVASNPQHYLGRCVTIRGVLHLRYLFDQADDAYRFSPDFYDHWSSGGVIPVEKFPGKGLQLYDTWPDALPYRKAVVTGLISRCLDLEADVFSAGYCHGNTGAFLMARSVEVGEVIRPRRRLRAAAGPQDGDLVEASDTWRGRLRAEALADRFLAALRSGDEAAVSELMDPSGSYSRRTKPTVRYVLGDRRSPFRELRTQTKRPQTIVLRWKLQRYLSEPGQEAALETEADGDSEVNALVCFCRTEDCSALWPIDSSDAINVPSRPYACIETTRFALRPGVETDAIDITVHKSGRIEPTKWR